MALQFEITDSTGTAVQDISDVASNKRYTPRLNLPWTAACRFPSHLVPIADLAGYHRLKVRDNGTIKFNGIIWTVGDDGNENTCYTEITAIDPVGAFFPRRPARDADGDFSKPSFITDFVTGPQIVEEILANSVTYEGDMGIASGSWAGSGVDLTGVPVDWPMTLSDIMGILCATGELDVVPTPSDTTDGVMVTLDGYNGDFGTDLSATVNFDWGTGDFNARSMRRTQSMETICNKLWYYLGPRVLTSSDPAGDQHWRGNITGDGMPDGAGGSTPLPNPPGGDVDFSNPLGDLINASRSDLGVYMDINVFDGDAEASVAYLYARMWQTEVLLRQQPRQMLYVTPNRGTALSFHIGDLITLNAGSKMRGGFSNATQRVYSYTVSESDDGVSEITDITTSADQEAA
jgi:hypothetical protein